MDRSLVDDEALLGACAEGDEQALGTLYDRHSAVAYRLALRIVRDAALAEDVVQEAFLTLWGQAERYDRSRGGASSWILVLVHRRAVDCVRRQARFYALQERLEAPPSVVEATHDEASLREVRRDVQAALSTLSRAEREVLDLAYWGGLTQSEIALALDIPSGR